MGELQHVNRKAMPSGYCKLRQEVPSFKARMKAVTVLVDRQLYGSELHTEGEFRVNDFADIMTDIRGIVSSSLMEDRNVLVGM